MRARWWKTCGIALAASLAALSGAPPGIQSDDATASSPSTWYSQNPLPRDFHVSAIACRSATSCVAAGLDGSIATTEDDGQHWTNRTTGIAGGLSYLACPGPAVCYALGSQAPSAGGSSQNVPYVLLTSVDGGATWQLASHFQENSHVFLNSLACPGSTTCLVGVSSNGQPGGPSILRTVDGGKTWQVVYLPGIVGLSTVVCPTSTVCYAVGANQSTSTLLRSGDSGKTWSGSGLRSPGWPPAIACPGENTCFGAASTCNAGCWGIFRTTNGAKSWKKVAGNPSGHPLGALACPSVTTCYVLAASGSNAYNTSVAGTRNGGKSWSVHNLPDSAFEIACPSQTACVLNAGFTVLATRDGFAHTREALARSPLHNLSLTSISCPSTTTCYAAGFRHVCDSIGAECDQVASPGAVTANGGRAWTTTPAPPELIGRLSCPSVTVCYSIAGETGNTPFVERSGDGARTWHRVFPSGGLSGMLMAISCPSVTTCYVTATLSGRGIPLAVLVTRNAGKTWTARRGVDALAPGEAAKAGMQGRSLPSVSCLSVTTCFVLGASFQKSTATVVILLTTNGGATWTRKSVPSMNAGYSPGAFSPPLACPTSATCYLLLSNGSALAPNSSGGVLVTHNGGAHWRKVVLQARAILTDMACSTADACRVAGWGSIFATTDGGTTWQRQGMADGGTVPQLAGIACPDAGTCYAVGGSFYAAVTIIGTRAPGATP